MSHVYAVALVVAATASAATVSAAELTLADSPVFLTQGVEPNFIMAIDDSGSMDYEVLLPGNDGAAWWRTRNLSGTCTAITGGTFVGCISNGITDLVSPGRLNFNNGGTESATWKKYIHLFPNGTDGLGAESSRRRLADGTHQYYAIPPIPEFGWARSPEHNAAYFDPTEAYEPWVNGGGYTFANVPPTSARFDPVYGTGTGSDKLDLTRDVAGSANADVTATCSNTLPAPAANWYFRVHTGMTLPVGTCIRSSGTGNNWETTRAACAVGVNNGCLTVNGGGSNQTRTIATDSSVAIRYFPATVYLSTNNGFPGYNTANALPLGLAPNGTTLYRYEIKPANFATTADYNKAIQNFANWFTYYRKRHQALRAGLGGAFKDVSGIRVAGFTINNNTANANPSSINVQTTRDALYTNFYSEWTGTGGTPNRNAVANILRNFRRTDASAPIQYACQKNFGMLFTDGFSNTGGGFDTVGNVDGASGAPFADSTSNTMADGVMGGYINNLRSSLPLGKVPVSPLCADPTHPLSLDCNANLHMNFHAVTLGTRGIVFDPDITQDPFASPPAWPTQFFQRHPSAVDDLWHATINGRGKLLNARTPKEIATKLKEVLLDVSTKPSSASAAAVSGASIRPGSQAFQAQFVPKGWTGDVLAYKVSYEKDSLGSLSEKPEWQASKTTFDPTTREIFTQLAGRGVPFQYSPMFALDPTRLNVLGANQTAQESMINFIRGDRSNEGTAVGQFRVRESVLGDIVNSAPLFVGRPGFPYDNSFPDKNYATFSKAKSTRTPAVYVGANDGMLHAFNANDGKELFAFVPNGVLGNLPVLASQSYEQNHRFFVDGSPNMGDVYINGAWRTVVVGGLNKGGQSIYALDVTNPSGFSASDVLWEFTDNDLGYTYGQPSIVKLHNGSWGAVFSNGYNSSENDGTRGSGKAMLFIVDLSDGTIIRKIDTASGTQATPNGLATPTVIDFDRDYVADYVYAGDLNGNMWKFDLRDPNEDNWNVAYLSGSTPRPLYVARDSASALQPITTAAAVARGPNGAGMLVLFGTGKFLEFSDRTSTTTQSFYGIYDPNAGPSDPLTGRASLGKQENLEEIDVDVDGGGTAQVRVTTANNAGTRGWYMDLLDEDGQRMGERVNSDVVYRDDRIIFTTVIPSSDLCTAGGDSWIMELNPLTGGRLKISPIDVNRDGKIDEKDFGLSPEAGGLTPGSGFKSLVGIVNGVGIAADPNNPVEFKYLAGSDGRMQTVRESADPRARGRQSWRVVR
jgi:type IV pilus assembly protein PilY1